MQPLNQVIIWDKIVTSKDTAWLQEKNEFVKYALIDQGQELRSAICMCCMAVLCGSYQLEFIGPPFSDYAYRNKTVSLRLMWDHMPVTGRLYNGDERKSSFTLPSKYKN